MRKLALAAVALVAAVAVVPSAAAKEVIRLSFELEDESFPDVYLSEVCGTDVTVTVNGTLTAKIFLDKEGEAVREIDTVKGTFTYSAGDESVTRHVSQVSTTQFLGGASVGSEALITIQGVGGGTVVGGPPGAGRLVFSAEVVAVEDGIPFTQVVGDPLQAAGNFDRATADICAALT